MNEITLSDIAKYAHNKHKQTLGVVFGVVVPALIVTTEYFGDNDEDLPQILNHEEARKNCLTDSFDNTSITAEGFNMNLTLPEIDDCALPKIAQSEQTQLDYIEEREDNAWKPYALAGAWAVAGLLTFAYGFRSNRQMREEKPGIEKMRSTKSVRPPTLDS